LTWFSDTPNQEIDWDVQKKHLSFLVESGLHGIVLAGTNGEAVTLSPSEKSQLVKTTRQLAIELGRPELTVILGCGGGSTRQVIEETILAKEAGADFALVLVPSYFHFAMNEDAIVAFFEEVGTTFLMRLSPISDFILSSQTPAPSQFSSTTSPVSQPVWTSTQKCSRSWATTQIS
jgi:dihydrodipicolinate synthase/N-acetylneuraminate lyase